MIGTLYAPSNDGQDVRRTPVAEVFLFIHETLIFSYILLNLELRKKKVPAMWQIRKVNHIHNTGTHTHTCCVTE